jgi:hypothetical protein
LEQPQGEKEVRRRWGRREEGKEGRREGGKGRSNFFKVYLHVRMAGKENGDIIKFYNQVFLKEYDLENFLWNFGK